MKQALAINGGSPAIAALHMCVAGCGEGAGDEVITSRRRAGARAGNRGPAVIMPGLAAARHRLRIEKYLKHGESTDTIRPEAMRV